MVRRGRATNEVLGINDIVVRDGDVWVSGNQDCKVLRLSLLPDERRFEVAEIFRFEKTQFMRIAPRSDGKGFLILDSSSSDNRMILMDRSGVVQDTVGSFPELERVPAEWKPNNSIFQSDLSIAPNGRHTVLMCRSIDCIDIYDKEMELQRRLRGPLGVEFGVRVFEAGSFVQHIQDPMYFMFDGTVCDDDRFLVGYVGVRPQTEADFGRKIGSVLSFDWSGRPQKCYDLEQEILSFDVDWSTGRMYCLTNEAEPRIVWYDLDF